MPTRLLRALWRATFGVDPAPLYAGIARLHLWESPCGLAFWDPPVPGDAAFYRGLYGRNRLHSWLGEDRAEFRTAAAHIRPGSKVLDVGCGEGAFADHIPRCTHVGLDPFFAGTAPPGRDIRAEQVVSHAAAQEGAYDVAVAFQVMEHLPDPLGFARDVARCVRPGGLVMLGVPLWPSSTTAIPNFVLNAPPHHCSLWTPQALRAVAAAAELTEPEIVELPASGATALLAWAARLAPKRPAEPWFRHAWSWHAGLAWSLLGARVMHALAGPPSAAPPCDALMVARKRG
ncbi:bifunctional 2-polyprenyl-6-hydroxyphenol methylase/3-demethylubiquinol 3-O-methyltransferase UbiG [Roseomonas sp. AR75]|uniref:class I SAM-dependent methyltransferase n=1 Tax=Roseomonas sp. AR75 TaxID=2562311 RepID=UPI0014859874|nr:class I SAM-dependent methyltransferase [Roseomonas sp. AR75]